MRGRGAKNWNLTGLGSIFNTHYPASAALLPTNWSILSFKGSLSENRLLTWTAELKIRHGSHLNRVSPDPHIISTARIAIRRNTFVERAGFWSGVMPVRFDCGRFTHRRVIA
jgi:hypothetical protein